MNRCLFFDAQAWLLPVGASSAASDVPALRPSKRRRLAGVDLTATLHVSTRQQFANTDKADHSPCSPEAVFLSFSTADNQDATATNVRVHINDEETDEASHTTVTLELAGKVYELDGTLVQKVLVSPGVYATLRHGDGVGSLPGCDSISHDAGGEGMPEFVSVVLPWVTLDLYSANQRPGSQEHSLNNFEQLTQLQAHHKQLCSASTSQLSSVAAGIASARAKCISTGHANPMAASTLGTAPASTASVAQSCPWLEAAAAEAKLMAVACATPHQTAPLLDSLALLHTHIKLQQQQQQQQQGCA